MSYVISLCYSQDFLDNGMSLENHKKRFVDVNGKLSG